MGWNARLDTVQVQRDFELVYGAEDDPWAIGDADSERYEHYRELLLEHARTRGALLDVGCGFGAFLARFRGEFDHLSGVEFSHLAVEKGRRRFPFIDLREGVAQKLDAALDRDAAFDAIVFSDVVCYLEHPDRHSALSTIARRLRPDGLAFIAAWVPGGDYLEPGELRHDAAAHFAVEHAELLETGHLILLCRRKRRLVAMTVDHETWQPLPEGRTIDWEADVFAPTNALVDACDAESVPLTLFTEMGEYFWAREHAPEVADRFAAQWAEAARRGHDVQLHLHPHWLPELGARQEADGSWHWDFSYQRVADYPGDLSELLARCVRGLEAVIRPLVPGYRVRCYRAGTYLAQPFDRLYEALVANGIECDSSVYQGGAARNDAPYDFRLAWSDHQPWFAARTDPQLKAPPAELGIVEMPVTTWAPADRWTFDTVNGATFADQLLRHADADPLPAEVLRRRKRWRERLGRLYVRARCVREALNVILPRRLAWALTEYPPEPTAQHDYFVAIGHSKADLDVDAIREGFRRLRDDGRFEFVSMTTMAAAAREDLKRETSTTPDRETAPVRRKSQAVTGDSLQSELLQRMVPLDTERVLVLGCGAETGAVRITEQLPWTRVLGVDVGSDFVSRARELHGSIDCLYADSSLELAFDVDETLQEVAGVLTDDGVLVAALRSDARNPARVCDDHTWKTYPDDVGSRLLSAGFDRVRIRELDTFRRIGMPPYPPSRDRMMYVHAAKGAAADPWGRILRALAWVHARLDPERPHQTDDPIAILAGGHAWCMGYTLALGELLRREGTDVRWVTLEAHGHPRGRGAAHLDTHEVLEVAVGARRRVLDPMAGTWFDASVAELLGDPARAIPRTPHNDRWVARGYELYATSFLYERVRRVALRNRPWRPHRFLPARAYLLAAALPRPKTVKAAEGAD